MHPLILPLPAQSFRLFLSLVWYLFSRVTQSRLLGYGTYRSPIGPKPKNSPASRRICEVTCMNLSFLGSPKTALLLRCLYSTKKNRFGLLGRKLLMVLQSIRQCQAPMNELAVLAVTPPFSQRSRTQTPPPHSQILLLPSDTTPR